MAKAVARMLRTTIMPARRDRIRQDVADISSPGELLRYALAGQLERLKRRGYNHGEIAMGAGFGTSPRNAGPALATALRYGPKADQLHRLDEVIGTLDQRMDGTGGLSSLALRLSEDRRDTIKSSLLAARVPARWTTQVLADPPGGEVGVLLQASAVLSEFMAVGKMRSDAIATIRDRYETDLELLVRRLSLSILRVRGLLCGQLLRLRVALRRQCCIVRLRVELLPQVLHERVPLRLALRLAVDFGNG